MVNFDDIGRGHLIFYPSSVKLILQDPSKKDLEYFRAGGSCSLVKYSIMNPEYADYGLQRIRVYSFKGGQHIKRNIFAPKEKS